MPWVSRGGRGARDSHPAYGTDTSERRPAFAGSAAAGILGCSVSGLALPVWAVILSLLCAAVRAGGGLDRSILFKLIRKSRDGRKPVRSRLPYPPFVNAC